MSDIAEAKTVYEIVEFQEHAAISDLSTPAGEALSAYIDGKTEDDCPYPIDTSEYAQWMLGLCKVLQNTIKHHERVIIGLRDENKSLLEQMG
jgi:hypothetical protein